MTIQAAGPATLTLVSPATGSAAGGLGVTLTGTNLSGATDVSFGGVAATSVNVVNSTTVTAVTPAHAAGAVNVAITTPAGSATLQNGYTYATTAVGQPAYGGTIACLNGGLNNLIAATNDNSDGIEWGNTTTTTRATSTTDGGANTTTIVATLGNNGGTPYAAKLCSDYAVDAFGNPCTAGTSGCYSDWFLPAGNNLTNTGQLDCLRTNRVAIGGFTGDDYWSSTEADSSHAWFQFLSDGNQFYINKGTTLGVRCVRAFNP